MMITLGNLALGIALLVATAAVLAAVAAARFGSPRLLAAAKTGLGTLAALLTVSSIALFALLVGNDFRVDYVAHYVERALPLGYKLAAFWAGQDGSLLLWAWMMAAMSLIAVARLREPAGDEKRFTQNAVIVATLALVCGFFVALMLCAANPFRLAATEVPDGHGLNPMLQNIGMIAHPPLLFLGYGGFAIPFAIMLGALVAGRGRDDAWVGETRRWALTAWVFLSAGILLGAQWAYVELGWGGYWAWDPVENASLLPWLTGTAMLHSIMAQQHRGALKVWNVALIATTFILCIFGTYLTRSGVVQSVHAFEASSIGTFFLAFLAASILGSIVVIIWRRRDLRATGPLGALVSREAGFFAGNLLLVSMAGLTAVGTIFPLISGLFRAEPVSVSQPFYNKAVLPLALALIAIMALGPALGESGGLAKLFKRLMLPAIAAAIAAAILVKRHQANAWTLTSTIVCAVAVTCFVVELARAWAARIRVKQENPLLALLRLLDGNHRRYGGQIVHMAMVMIVAGIAGSSLFSLKETFQLTPGQTVAFAGGTLRFEKLQQVQHANYMAMEAVVTLTDARGVATTLNPQRRFFEKWEESNSEVAIQSDLRKDIYLTLAGWEEGGTETAIQAIVNPLVNWIWIGGMVLVLGTLVCLLPKFESHPRLAVESTKPSAAPARVGAVAT